MFVFAVVRPICGALPSNAACARARARARVRARVRVLFLLGVFVLSYWGAVGASLATIDVIMVSRSSSWCSPCDGVRSRVSVIRSGLWVLLARLLSMKVLVQRLGLCGTVLSQYLVVFFAVNLRIMAPAISSAVLSPGVDPVLRSLATRATEMIIKCAVW